MPCSVTRVEVIPSFTTEISEVSLFSLNFVDNKSGYLLCLSLVEPTPSVIESPKQTIASFLVCDIVSIKEMK